MIIELKIPDTGMGITEGTIHKWHKSAGDAVRQGELLAEIETAKAIAEITSPADGVLEQIVLDEAGTADVNATIALIRAR